MATNLLGENLYMEEAFFWEGMYLRVKALATGHIGSIGVASRILNIRI